MKNVDPELTSWAGARVVASAARSTPSAAGGWHQGAGASPGTSVPFFPNVGLGGVTHATFSRGPSHSRSIGCGPTPNPNVVFAVPALMAPEAARAKAVPIVGCPANGTSP